MPKKIYLSEDRTCRDLLTRESAVVLNIFSSKSCQMTTFNKQSIYFVFLDDYNKFKVQTPNWTQGTWLSIGVNGKNTNTFHINQSQLIMKMSDNPVLKHDLKFLHVIQNQRNHSKSIRIRAKSLEEW